MEFGSKKFVSRDAAGENNGFGFWMEFARFFELLDNNVDSGLLEAGSKVGNLLLG